MPSDSDAPRPLHPMVGNLWVPAWAVRPGSYRALQGLTKEMPLWLAIHSRSGDHYVPCYHTREQLGATIGVSRRTVSRYLDALRRHALLFEVDRGEEPKTRRRRPPARWALDPYKVDDWRERVEEALARVAEEDGQSSHWYFRATELLDRFDGRQRALRNRLEEDVPARLQKKRRRRKKRKGRKAKQNNGYGPAVSFLAHTPFLAHEGIYPRVPPGNGDGGAGGVLPEPTGTPKSGDGRSMDQPDSPTPATDFG